MNYDASMAEITRQTVVNFRLFDENALSALAADLSLSLPRETMRLCRDHFRTREGRDPTVGELRFLDALAALWRRMPGAAVIDGITSEQGEDDRVLADLLRKADTLPRTMHSIPALMEVAGRYLSRCGITPCHENLRCGHPPELAALCAGSPPTLALELESTAAMLTPEPAAPSPVAKSLCLLFPTGNAPFATEVARFFAAHRGMGLSPVAAPKDEGLLPHLLMLGGLVFDATPLAGYRPEVGPASLLSLGRDTVLFLAPGEILPRFFAEGAPVVPCGMLNGSGWLQIRRGNELALSLSQELLNALRRSHKVHPILSPRSEEQISHAVTTSSTTLLGGVTAAGGCEQTLLSLIGDMAAKGADLSRATATAVLELPPIQEDSAAVAEALPLLLDYHRIVAEFALPTCHHRQLMRESVTKPRLSVFIAAEKSAPHDEAFAAAWAKAAEARDFATLRKMLHK